MGEESVDRPVKAERHRLDGPRAEQLDARPEAVVLVEYHDVGKAVDHLHLQHPR
jgi:hypothetical protein